MIKDERLDKIEAYVNRNRYATVKELSTYLNFSGATIRRDIETLSQQGRVTVTSGGVIPVENAEHNNVLHERLYVEKATSNMEEKMRIAAAASNLIQPGSVLIVDSGTTTGQLAPYLRQIPDLNLVTNDLFLASSLADAPNLKITVLGGALRQGYYSLIGHYTEQFVLDIRADMCIIGIDAVDLSRGLMISNDNEVGLKRSIINAANKVVVVCDHTKFETSAFLSVCALDRVDAFVTGEEIDKKILKSLQAMKGNVILAKQNNG